MSYKVTTVNVQWGYNKDPKSMFDNFATLELNYYGDSPKESTVKRELKALGLATKPIKHLQFFTVA